MKKATLISILIFLSITVIFAQSPQAFKYQAVLRNAQGEIRQNESVDVKISIRKNSASGTEVFSETHSTTTSEFGLVGLDVGTLNPSGFASIDWSDGPYFVKIFVDGSVMGTSQLFSVPYALFGEDEDANSSNELQFLSQSGYNVTLSQGGGTVSVEDGDADPENEFQTLSISGNDLTIEPNGNMIILPSGGGLTLPYFGTYSGSGDAFIIKHTGSSGGLAEFEISNSGNSGSVLFLETNGSGEAIDINNNGTGDAIFLSNQSNAQDAIYIKNYSNYNAIKAYGYGNNEVLYIKQTGTDDCAEIRIDNSSNSDDALYATTNGTGYAGWFYGDVNVNGTLSKSSGSFMIDHPLDPENKYLYHSFVESPDMMNVYNGNITTNENGIAIVQLPDYFEVLNKDFRYQLTCFGVFSQAIVYEKINNNHFIIKTKKPNVEVSWQVTGIRQDPYANQNRIQVEVEKSAEEKGHYLHYKEYNQPIEKSIEVVKNPDLLEELEKK